MSETSRRKFLAATGVGAAAGTVAIVTAGAAAGATKSANSAQEAVLAVVPDHRTGLVHLPVGEREVVVHDRDLATRILNAAGGQ
jgi:DMSO/TMAO reductase YedYZ molybdopterin-dependent catalytic subunit